MDLHHSNECYVRACGAASTGDWQTAADLLLQSMEYQPEESWFSFRLLAYALLKSNRSLEATVGGSSKTSAIIAFSLAMILQDPRDYAGWHLAAELLFETEAHADAIYCAIRAVQLNPDGLQDFSLIGCGYALGKISHADTFSLLGKLLVNVGLIDLGAVAILTALRVDRHQYWGVWNRLNQSKNYLRFIRSYPTDSDYIRDQGNYFRIQIMNGRIFADDFFEASQLMKQVPRI